MPNKDKWPKKFPNFSEEQKKINDDWQKYFHEINHNKFSGITHWGHNYVVRNSPSNYINTLEVGPGLGEHLKYEKLSEEQTKGYIGIELRKNMANEFKKNYPEIEIIIGNCEEIVPYKDGSFDRIIAMHLLEHLSDLPAFLKQATRLLTPTGVLLVIIPCEGGLGYSLGRVLTSKRIFEKRYKMPYDDFIKYEHLNNAREIVKEVKKYFVIKNKNFFPLKIPFIDANLILGLTLVKKNK